MPPLQQRSAATHNHILEAAETCFAENGYDATGVARICQTAGVSKGAFYHHFSSKQEVFLALLSRWLENTDRQLMNFQETTANFPDTIKSMAVVPQYILATADQNLPIYLEFLTKAVREPQIWNATVEPYRRYSELFAQMIEAGVDEGSLKSMDAQISARVIISFILGVLLQGLFDPEGADWGQVTQEGIRVLLNSWVKQ
jgi:AcrR family transcriptional regulator